MKNTVRSAVGALLFLGLVSVAAAQEVRTFTGRVIWIEANTMAFSPEVEGGAFDVDISKLDQSSYQFLKSGDRVTVVGVVTPDGNKLIASSIPPTPNSSAAGYDFGRGKTKRCSATSFGQTTRAFCPKTWSIAVEALGLSPVSLKTMGPL